MLSLPFQISTSSFVFMRTRLMKKLNRNLTEEEKSSQFWKILTQITLEDENELAEREEFLKQLTRESFDNENKLTLKNFFAFFSVFLLEGQKEERWKRLLDRHSFQFPKYSSVTLKS